MYTTRFGIDCSQMINVTETASVGRQYAPVAYNLRSEGTELSLEFLAFICAHILDAVHRIPPQSSP